MRTSGLHLTRKASSKQAEITRVGEEEVAAASLAVVDDRTLVGYERTLPRLLRLLTMLLWHHGWNGQSIAMLRGCRSHHQARQIDEATQKAR
jgi:hypothetical protein